MFTGINTDLLKNGSQHQKTKFKNAKDIFKDFDFGDYKESPGQTVSKPKRNMHDNDIHLDKGDQPSTNSNTILKSETQRLGNLPPSSFNLSITPIKQSSKKSYKEKGSEKSQLSFQSLPLSEMRFTKTPQNLKIDSHSLSQPDSTTNKEVSSDRTFIPKASLVRGEGATSKEIQEYSLFCKNSVDYCLSKLKQPKEEILMLKNVYLSSGEANAKEKLLLIDLNETLVKVNPADKPKEGGIEVSFFDERRKYEFSVVFRPFLFDFLRNMSKIFEIHVFTASNLKYAEKITELIDPEKLFISRIHSRDQCLETKSGLFIKDLRIFKGRSIKDIIIVDNFIHSFGFQLENGIPLFPWNGNPADTELPVLAQILMEACKFFDVRDYLRECIDIKNFNS